MTGPQLRTLNIWPVVTERAAHGLTVSYKKLAKLIGEPDRYRNLRPYLDRIQEFCLKQDLPNLSAIVVRKDTGEPGRPLEYPHGNWEREKAAVFAKDWASVTAPTAADIRR